MSIESATSKNEESKWESVSDHPMEAIRVKCVEVATEAQDESIQIWSNSEDDRAKTLGKPKVVAEMKAPTTLLGPRDHFKLHAESDEEVSDEEDKLFMERIPKSRQVPLKLVSMEVDQVEDEIRDGMDSMRRTLYEEIRNQEAIPLKEI
jgi:hypothetical protein